MNILIISDEFPPFGGGAGIVAYQNSIKLNESGHNVTVLTRNNVNKIMGIDIITINAHSKLFFLGYKKILSQSFLKTFDLIILNDMVSGYIGGKCLSDKDLNKSIYYLHGSEPEEIGAKERIYHRIIGFNKKYLKMIGKVKKIVAVSHYMKQKFIQSKTFESINYPNIIVDYVGVAEESNKDMDKGNIKKSDFLKLDSNSDVLLTVSRLERKKGFLVMYEIFKKIFKHNENYIWVIVGDGSFRNEFEKIIQEDGLTDKILVQGFVERESLSQYYLNADVFWLLSDFKEAFGLVYIEAQKYGLPAIGYNRYGVKEAISNNVSGFLVDDSEDVVSLILQKRYKELSKSDITTFSDTFKTNLLSICHNV